MALFPLKNVQRASKYREIGLNICLKSTLGPE